MTTRPTFPWSSKLLSTSASLLVLGTTALTLSATAARAETSPLVNEGIAGDIDKHHRAPLLTVSNRAVTNGVQILADATILNAEYQKYPIRFEFYVNRELYSTQIRSPELPGPVGVVVDTEAATVPFNYAVVATLLHTNRQFVSTIYGAVFSSALAADLSCTLTVSTSADDVTEYSATDVKTIQGSNGLFSISTTLTEAATGNTAALVGTIGVTEAEGEATASGDLKITLGGVAETVSTTGSATLSSGSLTAFEVEAASKYSLSCE